MDYALRSSLPERLTQCLLAREPSRKVTLTRVLWADWQLGLVAACENEPRGAIARPGCPARPELVSPLSVSRRRVDTREGRAALIHALVHIEFNAINLALDAALRFSGLPADFYRDWLSVAVEEARHFELLSQHLATLDHAYGDFAAHAGLWEMALKTAHDPLVRMALVPRVLEARGLDVTPGITRKLRQAGDARAVEILAVIERDEIGHVAIGSRWFAWLCEQRGLEAEASYRQLLKEYNAPQFKPPFNIEARRQAGFSIGELEWLSAQA
jgi:uncharacterized ferritin-like protein (DUF455 family)